ncbi:hypothetical protein WR25_01446 [Diploscapter pachys]|uniref:Uncharacterized protein n=1 Tax=Diploscapter pachys TaxID=2018661 RepID=A0A2A2KJ93_9BILA|nr:hypothetical protein WR25_01446 [Diploscapter pachys]
MNATSLGYPFIRRRDTIVDENAMQHLLLHESIWSHPFATKWRIGNHRRRSIEEVQAPVARTKWKRVLVYLQLAYEKSKIQSLFPILLLFAYSILGGFIFYSIERPSEESLLVDKSLYIESLKEELVNVLLDVHMRLRNFNETYSNNTHVLNLYHRAYRRYALNRIHRSVYWYTLSAFYLTEHEMHKALALRPQNPEAIWQKHFESNFGRIAALKNYTDQVIVE